MYSVGLSENHLVFSAVETIGSLVDKYVLLLLLHWMADNTVNFSKLSLSKENFDLEVYSLRICLSKLLRIIILVLLPHSFKISASDL